MTLPTKPPLKSSKLKKTVLKVEEVKNTDFIVQERKVEQPRYLREVNYFFSKFYTAYLFFTTKELIFNSI